MNGSASAEKTKATARHATSVQCCEPKRVTLASVAFSVFGTHEVGRALDEANLGSMRSGAACTGDSPAPAADDEIVIVPSGIR